MPPHPTTPWCRASRSSSYRFNACRRLDDPPSQFPGELIRLSGDMMTELSPTERSVRGSSRRIAWKRPESFLVAAVAMACLAGLVLSTTTDPDLWGHVTFGHDIVRLRAVTARRYLLLHHRSPVDQSRVAQRSPDVPGLRRFRSGWSHRPEGSGVRRGGTPDRPPTQSLSADT